MREIREETSDICADVLGPFIPYGEEEIDLEVKRRRHGARGQDGPGCRAKITILSRQRIKTPEMSRKVMHKTTEGNQQFSSLYDIPSVVA